MTQLCTPSGKSRAALWLSVIGCMLFSSSVSAQTSEEATYVGMADAEVALCEHWDPALTRAKQAADNADFEGQLGKPGVTKLRQSTDYKDGYREAVAESKLWTPKQALDNCTTYWGSESSIAKAKLARLPVNDDPSTVVQRQSDSLPDCMHLHDEDNPRMAGVSDPIRPFLANACNNPIVLEYCWKDVPLSGPWVNGDRFCASTGWLKTPTILIGGSVQLDRRPFLKDDHGAIKTTAMLSVRHVKEYKMTP